MRNGNGHVEPCKPPCVSKKHRYCIGIGNTGDHRISATGSVNPLFGNLQFGEQTFGNRGQNNLNDGIATSKGIKDFDNGINLKEKKSEFSLVHNIHTRFLFLLISAFVP